MSLRVYRLRLPDCDHCAWIDPIIISSRNSWGIRRLNALPSMVPGETGLTTTSQPGGCCLPWTDSSPFYTSNFKWLSHFRVVHVNSENGNPSSVHHTGKAFPLKQDPVSVRPVRPIALSSFKSQAVKGTIWISAGL